MRLLDVDKNTDAADDAFFSSPFEIDRGHMEVMDETTHGGSRGCKCADLQHAVKNPAGGVREVHLPAEA